MRGPPPKKALSLGLKVLLVLVPGGCLLGGGWWAYRRYKRFGTLEKTAEEDESIQFTGDELAADISIEGTDMAKVDTGYLHGRAFEVTLVEVQKGYWATVETAAAFARMHAAAEADGVTLTVTNGFRTMAKQQELYAAFKAKAPGAPPDVAIPGTSRHQSGTALDIQTKSSRDSVFYKWLAAHAHEYGFYNTVASEPWHWELKV